MISDGGTKESAGVILPNRGTGWAQAKAPASNSPTVANCPYSLFITVSPLERPLPDRLLYQ
jgi:hypothetical protein